MKKRDEIEEARLERELDPDFALISDYVAGELSPESEASVRQRLESDPEFRDRAEPLLLAWQLPRKVAPMTPDELTHAWLQLRRRAGRPVVPGQESLDISGDLSTVYRREKKARDRRVRSLALRAAALFIMLVGAPVAVHEMFQDDSATETVTLPNGTVVTLKVGSTLSYGADSVIGAAAGGGAARWGGPVHLRGEGRFDVKPGAGTLRVFTDAAEVRADSSSFSMRTSDAGASYIEVHSGIVWVRGRPTDPRGFDGLQQVRAGSRVQVMPGHWPIPYIGIWGQ